jgi:prepilin-type N-terminal cleavage/methylation domain-containing protein
MHQSYEIRNPKSEIRIRVSTFVLRASGRRSGFTLIELLVVIALLLFLLAMTVALWPKFNERQKVQKGADQLAEWLLTAKQMAKRDGAPRGLRLSIDPNGFCSTAYYIEQLPDLKGGLVTVLPGAKFAWLTQNASGGQTVDITGGADTPPFGNKPVWAVLPGDRLEVVVNSGFLSNDVGPNPTKLTYVIADTAVLAWGGAPSFTPTLMGLQLGTAVQVVPPISPQPNGWSSRGAAFGGVDTLGFMVPPPVPPPVGPTINQIYVADLTNITVGTNLVIDQATPPSPSVFPNGAVNAPVVPPEERVRVIGGAIGPYAPMLPFVTVDPGQPAGTSAGYLYVQGAGTGGGLLYAPPSPPPTYHSTSPAKLFPVRSYRYPYQTQDYRIIRQPRVLTGENPLELPQNVVVDFTFTPPMTTPNLSFVPGLAPGQTQVDILFSPSGALLSTDQTIGSKAIFWLRDRTLNPPDPPGDQVLIGVFFQTGQISAHPPDLSNPPNSYFNYFLDGRSSGM